MNIKAVKSTVVAFLAAVVALTLVVGDISAWNAPQQIVVEGEGGTGDGESKWRSNASALRTIWLHQGEARTLSLPIATTAAYRVTVRYSNDHIDGRPLEQVVVRIDGAEIGRFEAEDTGNWGYGWNQFRVSPPLGNVELTPGEHEIEVKVDNTYGDGYGVEIDAVILNQVSP